MQLQELKFLGVSPLRLPLTSKTVMPEKTCECRCHSISISSSCCNNKNDKNSSCNSNKNSYNNNSDDTMQPLQGVVDQAPRTRMGYHIKRIHDRLYAQP